MSSRSNSSKPGVRLPPLGGNGNNKFPRHKFKLSKNVEEPEKPSPTPTSCSQTPEKDVHSDSPAVTASDNLHTAKSSSPATMASQTIKPFPPQATPPHKHSEVVKAANRWRQLMAPTLSAGSSDAVNIFPFLKAMVPQLPSVLQKLSNSQDTSTSQGSRTHTDTELKINKMPVQDRMTMAYVEKWTPRQDDVEQTAEEVEFVIRLLKMVEPTFLLFNSVELAPRFALLHSAMTTADLSDDFKTKMLQIFLDNGWSSFLASYLHVFHDVENWDTQFVITAAANLVKGLKIFLQPLFQLSTQFTGQIFDHHFDTVYDALQKPFMMKFRGGPQEGPAYEVLSELIFTLQAFVLVEFIRDEKFTEDTKAKVKSLCAEYVEALKERSDLSVTCSRLLEFLEDDKNPFPQLSATKLIGVKVLEDKLPEHLEKIEYVLKRLTSVTAKDRMALPLKYTLDYSFMLSALPIRSGFARENENRILAAIIKDGLWHKLIIEDYTTLFIGHTDLVPSNQKFKWIQVNIINSLIAVGNATDICKDAQMLQQAFDQLADFFVEQLKSEFIRTALKEGFEINPAATLGAAMLTFFHNFSYYHEPSVSVMREKGMLAIARGIRKECKDSSNKTSCLLIIAYLLNESDDKQMMKVTDDEVSFLKTELEKSMVSIETSGYHPEEIIDGFNRIAVIDDNKKLLVDCGVLELLKESVVQREKYTSAHIVSAIKAIWNLSFSEDIRKEILASEELMDVLTSLKKSEDEEIQAAAAGVLWQLERKLQTLPASDVKEDGKRHIMLSYNHQAKEEVHKMKDRLKQMGYKVWIDSEHIAAGASTLEAMSNAIEESCLVLIFFSEPYKNSVNCRAEAEYVFERQKPFLPVQVQAGYKPDGWLGILFGSKYRYTLSKLDKYESEVSGLMSKITELTSEQSASIDVVDAPIVSTVAPTFTSTPSVYKKAKLECESWSCEQVQEWVKENGLDKYMESLSEMDGEMLADLVRLSCDHKEVFYTMMSKTEGIGLMGVLRLRKAIQKLAQ